MFSIKEIFWEDNVTSGCVGQKKSAQGFVLLIVNSEGAWHARPGSDTNTFHADLVLEVKHFLGFDMWARSGWPV